MGRLLLFFLIAFGSSSQTWVANDIAGVWINSDKDAHIKIFGSYGKYYGQVVWMKNPNDSITGKPQLDKMNKDPLLQSRPVMNMIVLNNLVFSAENQMWSDGTIYNPKTGETYDVFGRMLDKNTIQFRFYIAITTLGKTVNWTRIVQ